MPVSTDKSDRPLTPNDRLLLAREAKRIRKQAEHMGISFERYISEIVSEGPATIERGGARRGAGRKPRDWEGLTGHPLSRLTLMILVEQALVKGGTGAAISRKLALDRIIMRQQFGTVKGATADCEKEFKAYQHAMKRPAAQEVSTGKQRRDFDRATAWLDHVERSRCRRPAAITPASDWRAGASWVRIGASLIVNGRPASVSRN